MMNELQQKLAAIVGEYNLANTLEALARATVDIAEQTAVDQNNVKRGLDYHSAAGRILHAEQYARQAGL